jgi:hypothetical protein
MLTTPSFQYPYKNIEKRTISQKIRKKIQNHRRLNLLYYITTNIKYRLVILLT